MGRIQQNERQSAAQECKECESRRPSPGLVRAGKERLNYNWIAQKREQRAGIRKSVEAIRRRSLARAGVPRLQQRARGAEQKIRQADGEEKQQQNMESRIFAARWSPRTLVAAQAMCQCLPPTEPHESSGAPVNARTEPERARKDSRAEAPSGRRAGKRTRPRPTRRTTAESFSRSSAGFRKARRRSGRSRRQKEIWRGSVRKRFSCERRWLRCVSNLSHSESPTRWVRRFTGRIQLWPVRVRLLVRNHGFWRRLRLCGCLCRPADGSPCSEGSVGAVSGVSTVTTCEAACLSRLSTLAKSCTGVPAVAPCMNSIQMGKRRHRSSLFLAQRNLLIVIAHPHAGASMKA